MSSAFVTCPKCGLAGYPAPHRADPCPLLQAEHEQRLRHAEAEHQARIEQIRSAPASIKERVAEFDRKWKEREAREAALHRRREVAAATSAAATAVDCPQCVVAAHVYPGCSRCAGTGYIWIAT